MTTTFETAEVGDKVWCMRSGWVVIKDICNDEAYPISVELENGSIEEYTMEGLYNRFDAHQSLFWDEIKFEAPRKPLPELEVDAKVIVWGSGIAKFKRHFSHFNESGKIECFSDGMTSWVTEHTREWDNWELPEQ